MHRNDGSGEDEPAFGAQLLAAIRERGLPLSGFDYAVLQELKRADREETIRVLRGRQPLLEYAAVQALRHEEPAAIAARLAHMRERASTQTGMTMLMMIALMT